MISCGMRCSSRAAYAALLLLTGTISGCSLALDFDATSKDYSPSGAGGGSNNGPYCSQHAAATLCDDFDGTSLNDKWNLLPTSNGSVRADSAASFSAPNSLLSVADKVAQGGQVRAVTGYNFTEYASASKAGFRTSFELRVDAFDPTNGAKNIAFAYLFGSSQDFNQIVMNLVSNGSSVSLQVAENSQTMGSATSLYQLYGPFATKLAVGQWIKVDLDIDAYNLMGSGNRLRVHLDGTSVLDTALMYPLKGGTPRLELGVGWVDSSAPAQGWTVRYDNFSVEVVSL